MPVEFKRAVLLWQRIEHGGLGRVSIRLFDAEFWHAAREIQSVVFLI